MEDSLEDYIKMYANTKDKETEIDNKMRTDILITAQRKKECENHAMKIVEFLIDGQLHPEVFVRCLKFINPELYQDVVEERAITNLCGYSICGKKIPEMPKKQYHISVKANKIYDISDRKNYCSNFCYKASIYIKKQIDTSPLWLRNFENAIKFKLLPATAIGIPGEVIDHGIAKPEVEPKFTSVSSFTQMTLNEVNQLEIKPEQVKSEESQNVKPAKLKVNTMDTITENDEITLIEEETEIVDEIEADYNISKVIKVESMKKLNNYCTKQVKTEKKELEENLLIQICNINDKQNIDMNKTKNKSNTLDITNAVRSEVQNANPKPCENVNAVSSKFSKVNDVSKQQKSSKVTDSKEKFRKPSLEELISKHKEKQKQNTKMVKTIHLSEIVSLQSPEKSVTKVTKENTNKKVSNIDVNKQNVSKTVTSANNNEQVNSLTNKLSTMDIKQTSCLNSNERKETKIDVSKVENIKYVEKETKETSYCKILEKIYHCIKQWLTIETYIYLYGEEKIKQILNEKKLGEYFEKLKITELETSQQLKYMEICKRLHMRELAEETFDRSIIGQKLQPLPDYKRLKEENKDMNLKVKSFYCGVLYEKADSNFPSNGSKKEVNSEEGSPAVLPLVDASSQNAMRRKVFLNSINKTLHGHIHELHMDASLVFTEVQSLVKTFKLQAKNVVFKPLVWNIIALVLIKIVSYRDINFKNHLDEDKNQEYFKLVFSKFSNYELFLSDICKFIEDIDAYIEAFITTNDCQ